MMINGSFACVLNARDDEYLSDEHEKVLRRVIVGASIALVNYGLVGMRGVHLLQAQVRPGLYRLMVVRLKSQTHFTILGQSVATTALA